eukprot:PhF_6_TR29298/c0_g1_i1/m.42956
MKRILTTLGAVSFVFGAIRLCSFIGTRAIRSHQNQTATHEKTFVQRIHSVLRGDHQTLPPPPLPCALVDMSAFLDNATLMVDMCLQSDKKIRVATKSIRCTGLMDAVINRIPKDKFAGLMAFTAQEAYSLAATGKYHHILVAYPVADVASAECIIKANLIHPDKVRVAVMVDSVEQVDVLDKALSQLRIRDPAVVPVWIDIDMSLKYSSYVHLGVRRSPLRKAPTELCERLGKRLEGIMGYEAQVAGLQDFNSSSLLSLLESVIRKWIKTSSMKQCTTLRSEVLKSINRDIQCNGGGSGSLTQTLQDKAVTEVTIGSGCLCGHLFDHYLTMKFKPALYIALPVTRRPCDGIVTCLGGGWIASGPVEQSRWPKIVYPWDGRFLSLEGAGEVQTPISTTLSMQIGDVVILRPAKSGEMGEIFPNYYLLENGDTLTVVKTYKGMNIPTW